MWGVYYIPLSSSVVIIPTTRLHIYKTYILHTVYIYIYIYLSMYFTLFRQQSGLFSCKELTFWSPHPKSCVFTAQYEMNLQI